MNGIWSPSTGGFKNWTTDIQLADLLFFQVFFIYFCFATRGVSHKPPRLHRCCHSDVCWQTQWDLSVIRCRRRLFEPGLTRACVSFTEEWSSHLSRGRFFSSLLLIDNLINFFHLQKLWFVHWKLHSRCLGCSPNRRKITSVMWLVIDALYA